jgi:hypothetical protein
MCEDPLRAAALIEVIVNQCDAQFRYVGRRGRTSATV